MKKSLIPLLSLFFISCFSPQAQCAETPHPLVGYIKCKPLPGLTSKAMETARRIYPGPQTEVMPLMLLGSFGYPNFPGLSTQENVSFFFFASPEEEDPSMVGLAKIAKDSTLYDALVAMQFALKEHKGYTFFATHSDNLMRMGDMDALIAKNQKNSKYDIKLKVITDNTFDAAGFIEAIRANSIETEDTSLEDERIASAIETFAKEVANTKAFTLGLAFEDAHILIYNSIIAQKGTQLHQFLSQPTGGPVDGARYLSSDDSILSSVLKADPNASKAYIDYALRQCALSGQTTSVKDAWNSLADSIALELKNWNGSVLKVQSSKDGSYHLTEVIGGNYSEADLAQMNNNTPRLLMDLVALELFNNGNAKLSVNNNLFTVSKTAVNHIGFKINKDLAPEYLKNILKEDKTSDQLIGDLYNASLEGNILAAYHKEDITDAIERMSRRQKAPLPLSETMKLRKSELMMIRFDLAKYLKSELDEYLGHMINLDLLAYQEPLVSISRIKSGKFANIITLPIETLAELGRTYRQIPQESSQPTNTAHE